MSITVGSLCTGYGGLDLGVGMVEDAHMLWCADNDKYASVVVEHRFPHAPNLGDVTMIDWGNVPHVDVLTAGYPCQPFSQAGLRKGTDDARHLWPHIATGIRCLRPGRVFLENVPGHLTMGFGEVLGSLAEMGYDTKWCCVKASDAGAPHRRERVFIVATDSGSRRTGWDDRTVQDKVEGGRREEKHDVHALGYADSVVVADPDRSLGGTWDTVTGNGSSQNGGRGETEPGGRCSTFGWGKYEPAIRRWEQLTRPAPQPTDDRGRLNRLFVEWMMGVPEGWVTDTGISRKQQLKCLGNGVVPQAAAIAWRNNL